MYPILCTINRVINTENQLNHSTLRWDSVTDEQIKYYKSCLNNRLQLFTIADTINRTARQDIGRVLGSLLIMSVF